MLRTPEIDTPETFTVIEERDLIPEGTAYDPVSEQVFISSMYKRKIVAIRKDGTYYDFIKEAQDSIWGTLGLAVDSSRHKLWVISSKGEAGIVTRVNTADGSWDSRLFCYNLDSGLLAKTYCVASKVPKGYCFNDLTISAKGDVYITESISNKIFHLQQGADSIDVFLAPEGYTFLNGITLSSDGNILFVSGSEGLLYIDLKTKAYKPLPYAYTTDPNPIDGLTYYRHSLIGHQSKILTRFFLSEQNDTILRHEVIDTRGLDSSTTGEMGNDGWYYYIVNSQIRSGVDYAAKKTMPWDSLQPVEIRKVRL